jgi:hypothetical protein
LAFAGREDQESLIRAATYSDQWAAIKDSSGRLKGAVESYYICMAKTAWDGPNTAPCLSVTPSKDWDTKHEDISIVCCLSQSPHSCC